jgi:hypothetical protein
MNNIRSKTEWKLIRNIRNNLVENELNIKKADKGKILLYSQQKIHTKSKQFHTRESVHINQ